MESGVTWRGLQQSVEFQVEPWEVGQETHPIYCDLAHLEHYQLELIPFSEPGSLLLDLIRLCSSVTFEINVSFSND